MTRRPGLKLPMIGPPAGGGQASDSDPLGSTERAGVAGTAPDPERLRAGWEHRFVADEARAREMAELYRELGFEVAEDPVVPGGLPDGCQQCFGGSPVEHRSIYTRRPGIGSPAEGGRVHTHPTRVLRDEHKWILKVADALDRLVSAPAEALDLDAVERCARFIRLFADACHHGKEEDLLFPALVERGLPRESGPIAVMLHEHRLGRAHVAAMFEALQGARRGVAVDRRRLLEASRDYVELIRNHILKEDNVLFEMADQIVDGPACDRLCSAYDGTCDHTFDGHTKAQLEALGREIIDSAAVGEET